MKRITRQVLQQLVDQLNTTAHDLGRTDTVYVLRHMPQYGGYQLHRCLADRTRMLGNDYIAFSHYCKPAKEMSEYLTGVLNAISEITKQSKPITTNK